MRRAGALTLGAGLLAACLTPTQATVEITSELAHREDMSVAIQLDAPARVEAAPPRAVTRAAWGQDGVVGTVVAVPDEGQSEFGARVVLAIGRDPSTCTAADARGCVVARRRGRFLAGESTRARVVLRAECVGVYCDAESTCHPGGACGPLDSDVPLDAGAPPQDAAAQDPYGAAVLADRPRHYFRLDEPAGSTVARDATGRADGHYQGGVRAGVTGALATSTNTGAYFDGAGGSIEVPGVDDLPGAMSVEAWVRSDGDPTGDGTTVLERLDTLASGSAYGYRLVRRPQGDSFTLFRGAERFAAEAPALRFAGYTYLAAVARGGRLEVYVDGLLRGERSFRDAPPPPVLSALRIGRSGDGTRAWRGAIDEVAIYDYPLSGEQIRRHRAAAGATP